MLRFLIVDDSKSDRLFMHKLAQSFPASNLEITEASTANEGLQICREQTIDLILLDYNLPDKSGVSFLNELQEIEIEILPAVVIVTSEISQEIDDLCLNNGAVNFLTKGNISQDSFLRSVKYALKGKEREQELNQLKKEYEEASKSKDKFLSYLSHEFRTPLTSIISTGELMCNRKLLRDPNIEELGRIINENGLQILNLIDDLMKLSSLSEKNIFLEYESIHVKELSVVIIEKLKKHHISSIDFKVNIKSDVPEVFSCDYYCLKQILRFLIENAYRNTFSGEILINISKPSQNLLDSFDLNPEIQYINFTVQDTGPGYSEATLHALQNAISQEQIPAIKTFNGNGIALTLASSLAKELKGAISIQSEIGRGTKINFTVPERLPKPKSLDETIVPMTHSSEETSLLLKQILRDQAKPILEDVMFSMSINEINDFLCKLKSLTINYKDKELYQWCKVLEARLCEYDIDKIMAHLRTFDQLID